MVLLEKLTEVREVRMKGAKVTDAGLAHLGEVVNLEYVHMGDTALTGAGFPHLKKLTKLRGLYLGGTRIRDEHLVHLAEQTGLKTIDLRSTKVTASGVDRLQKSLPRTEIWDDRMVP